jgi:L-lactate utilization protein LutB
MPLICGIDPGVPMNTEPIHLKADVYYRLFDWKGHIKRRYLLKRTCVSCGKCRRVCAHHINCDPQDNRLRNLVVVDRWQHNSAHASLEQNVKALLQKGVLKFNRKKLRYEVVT